MTCAHADTVRGKDIPRRWGSYRSEVCVLCGSFRARTHHDELVTDQRGSWRSASEYEEATAEQELD